MKVKPWQIAVIVIGLLVGLGSAVYQLVAASGPELPDSMLLIDVETGQVYRASTHGNGIMLPARRPDSQTIALLRLRKEDNGEFVVAPRDLGLLDYLSKDVQVKAIDAETGRVLNASKDIKPYAEPK